MKGYRLQGLNVKHEEPRMCGGCRVRTQLLASFPSDLTDCFPCVCFAFRLLLPPLFLAILFSHLHFVIYIWWTRRIQARLPCKFGLVTHRTVIQLAMKLIILLTVNLKTFLMSILSPSLTNHGKYSTGINVERTAEHFWQLRGEPSTQHRGHV